MADGLTYKDEVPIISASGCYRSAKPNVVDLILPAALAITESPAGK